MTGIPRIALTAVDVKRLRAGDIRMARASDHTALLLVAEDSPDCQHVTASARIVVGGCQLDRIEADPAAAQVVAVEGHPDWLFQLAGELHA